MSWETQCAIASLIILMNACTKITPSVTKPGVCCIFTNNNIPKFIYLWREIMSVHDSKNIENLFMKVMTFSSTLKQRFKETINKKLMMRTKGWIYLFKVVFITILFYISILFWRWTIKKNQIAPFKSCPLKTQLNVIIMIM